MNAMEKVEKAISLHSFIKELCGIKCNIITDIEKQQWQRFLNDIHTDDPEHIHFHSDIIGENNNVLLEVKKPIFDFTPEPPNELLNWLKTDYKSFNIELQCKDFLNEDDSQSEQFNTSAKRVATWEEYKKEHSKWAEKTKVLYKTRKLYDELFMLRSELSGNTETLELMVGNGFISMPNDSKIKYPILLKKVCIEFNQKENSLQVIDTDLEPELYTSLFNGMENIDFTVIKKYVEILAENPVHPLSYELVKQYLKQFMNKLSSDSRFLEYGEKAGYKDNIVMDMIPVFFMRKRIDGTLKFVEAIINHIKEIGEISGPIEQIIGIFDGTIKPQTEIPNTSIQSILAGINGESFNILLPKEANKEQLQVMEHIQNHNAVVVQGPPGTGKTHTIANALGHFLAEGKNVLVTSQTSKALSVLKDKLPQGIKGLCIPVFDDNVSEIEKSVNEISENISNRTPANMLREIPKIESARQEIINKLADIRQRIYEVKFQEFNPIVYNGESYSPLKIAKFVNEKAEELSYIPGKVSLHSPLPLSFEELKELYETNCTISNEEENELELDIPNPDEFGLTPIDYPKIIEGVNKARETKAMIEEKLNTNVSFDFHRSVRHIYISKDINSRVIVEKPNAEKLEVLKKALIGFEKLQKWEKRVICDGKLGGGFKEQWILLGNKIKETAKYGNETVIKRLGKNFQIETSVSIKVLIEQIGNMRKIASAGKKIKRAWFDKDFNEVLEKVRINDTPISSIEDCEATLSHIKLQEMRKDTSIVWDSIMAKCGLPKFNDLDENPEQVAKNYCEQIEKYIEWYNTEYSNLNEKIVDCGIIIDNLFVFDTALSEARKLEEMLSIISSELIDYIALIQSFLFLEQFNGIKENIIAVNSTSKRIASDICQKTIKAIKNENLEEYTERYKIIKILYDKYTIQRKRKILLEKLSANASEWALAVKNRNGIHGNRTYPETISNAWKWKQFVGMLDEISDKSFETLQQENAELSKQLRKWTEKLVIEKSWYNVLLKIEQNPNMKQALIGWSQTVKKLGKGKGKNAAMYKAKLREYTPTCQKTVPAWIMPVSRVMDNFNPKDNKFDVVIIDEASQSDISVLALFYIAKKVIVVGDDKQVSPSAVGMEIEKMNALREMYIAGKIPNSHLYDGKTSLYDIAMTSFQPLMLMEHFRCVSDIINYSNKLSYDFKIKPLRDNGLSKINPCMVNYRVFGERKGKINKKEAEQIIALILACIEQPEYKSKSFGIISLLGSEQVRLIQEMIAEKIDVPIADERRIRCGNAPDFQGDERDVVFLSMVDSNNEDGPLNMLNSESRPETKQRYNVAVSRARDQVWVVHSLDTSKDLKDGDIRRNLLEYSKNPEAFDNRLKEISVKSESEFENQVAKFLVERSFNIVQQWKIGAYRIDMVAICKDKKMAIECDGEQWHSTDEQIKSDMERQTILERLGWRFIRIRGSEYFKNPEEAMKKVLAELYKNEIEPESDVSLVEQNNELLERVKARASQIIAEWDEKIIEDLHLPQNTPTFFSNASNSEIIPSNKIPLA
jgi:very-short-patch-repair endonuclease